MVNTFIVNLVCGSRSIEKKDSLHPETSPPDVSANRRGVDLHVDRFLSARVILKDGAFAGLTLSFIYRFTPSGTSEM